MSSVLEPPDPAEASRRTLGHYDANAQSFWEGTRTHDVSQNIEALLRHLPAQGALRLLDFGCGPGRDLLALKQRGHAPIGLEGAAALAEMARQHSGCEVWQQNFLTLDLPANHFDGVFANASLFHVPAAELPRVLRQLQATLRPGGVLFSSNPRGDNAGGWYGDRYGHYWDWAAWRAQLQAAGFVALEHYYRPPGLPRAQQPWLASVWRKPAEADPASVQGA
jgi:SAM-dependent methyltransferase